MLHNTPVAALVSANADLNASKSPVSELDLVRRTCCPLASVRESTPSSLSFSAATRNSYSGRADCSSCNRITPSCHSNSHKGAFCLDGITVLQTQYVQYCMFNYAKCYYTKYLLIIIIIILYSIFTTIANWKALTNYNKRTLVFTLTRNQVID